RGTRGTMGTTASSSVTSSTRSGGPKRIRRAATATSTAIPTTATSSSPSGEARVHAALCHLMVQMLDYVTRHVRETNKVAAFSHQNDQWVRSNTLPYRSLESVHLLEADKQRLVTDLTQFYERRALYEHLGMMPKRGYLLTGPPGTGKTSLIRALAAHLKKSVAMITLDAGLKGDAALQKLVAQPPCADVFLVVEDVDRMMQQSSITLPCLLRILDGEFAKTPQVIIMTSNDPDALDEAVRRHGRVDVHVGFDYATQHQVRSIFRFIFGRTAAWRRQQLKARSEGEGKGEGEGESEGYEGTTTHGEGDQAAQTEQEEIDRWAEHVAQAFPT